MFAKLVALILALGVVGGVLLTIRQLRIQAAHELADVQRRVSDHDRQLWQLRIEIGARVQPEQVARRAESLGTMSPIGPYRYQELVQRETEAALAAAGSLADEHARVPAARTRRGGRATSIASAQ